MQLQSMSTARPRPRPIPAPGATMNMIRRGRGRPLLMLHGLGGSNCSWQTITTPLALAREVIAVDLPGFGESPPLAGETSIASLADAVCAFTSHHRLGRIDMVGSSMGARLALELARRDQAGAVVALNPGGFWSDDEKPLFQTSIAASIRLVRRLRPLMPAITANALGRSLLLSQFSPRPWRIPARPALQEMRDYVQATRFDELLTSLVTGPEQRGMAHASQRPIAIGWGRQDRVCFPHQTDRALTLFPHARLHWFEACGHFPHWDQPDQAVTLILETTR